MLVRNGEHTRLYIKLSQLCTSTIAALHPEHQVKLCFKPARPPCTCYVGTRLVVCYTKET